MAAPTIMNAAWMTVWILLGVVILATIAAFANRRRLKAKPQMPERDLLKLQAALLDAIKQQSANQRTIVNLARFWRNTGIKPYQRNAVIDPLIEAGDVTVHNRREPHGFWETAWDAVRDYWSIAAYRPPTKLILTDRTWIRMAHDGVSGQTIVFERVDVMHWQSQTAGGDIVQSPQTSAGGKAHVRFDSAKNSQTVRGLSIGDLTALVTALRQDVPQLPLPEERARVRDLATQLENELDQEDRDTDAIEDGVSRAERYVARAGGLMTATATLLDSWQRLRG